MMMLLMGMLGCGEPMPTQPGLMDDAAVRVASDDLTIRVTDTATVVYANPMRSSQTAAWYDAYLGGSDAKGVGHGGSTGPYSLDTTMLVASAYIGQTGYAWTMLTNTSAQTMTATFTIRGADFALIDPTQSAPDGGIVTTSTFSYELTSDGVVPITVAFSPTSLDREAAQQGWGGELYELRLAYLDIALTSTDGAGGNREIRGILPVIGFAACAPEGEGDDCDSTTDDGGDTGDTGDTGGDDTGDTGDSGEDTDTATDTGDTGSAPPA